MNERKNIRLKCSYCNAFECEVKIFEKMGEMQNQPNCIVFGLRGKPRWYQLENEEMETENERLKRTIKSNGLINSEQLKNIEIQDLEIIRLEAENKKLKEVIKAKSVKCGLLLEELNLSENQNIYLEENLDYFKKMTNQYKNISEQAVKENTELKEKLKDCKILSKIEDHYVRNDLIEKGLEEKNKIKKDSDEYSCNDCEYDDVDKLHSKCVDCLKHSKLVKGTKDNFKLCKELRDKNDPN